MRFFNQCAAKSFRVIFIAAFWFALSMAITAQTTNEATCNAQSNDRFTLTAECLHSPWDGNLNNVGWRYKAGDDTAWAARDFDDHNWEKLNSTLFNTTPLSNEGWTGAAWFRLRVSVDEPLAREIVALRLWHWGASEIYLDGKLLRGFGKIASNDNVEVEQNPRGLPVPLIFETSGEHIIAVRYSFAATRDFSINAPQNHFA